MERIFVVDDSLTNLAIIARGLSPYFNITTISSGEKLFEELDKSIPKNCNALTKS